MYTLFLQSFNIVLVGGGGEEKATHFETHNCFFKTPFSETLKINEIIQVSQGILSTIVWFSRLMETYTITMFFSPKCS